LSIVDLLGARISRCRRVADPPQPGAAVTARVRTAPTIAITAAAAPASA
jgi:hypothetical protein